MRSRYLLLEDRIGNYCTNENQGQSHIFPAQEFPQDDEQEYVTLTLIFLQIYQLDVRRLEVIAQELPTDARETTSPVRGQQT